MKPIPGFPGYFASEDGNIFSMKPTTNGKTLPSKPKLLAGSIDKDGYRTVNPQIRGIKHRPRTIGYLVLITFVSPRPIGMQVCHGVRGKLDDSLENLYWGTVQRNAQDRHRDGTDNIGEKHHNHKLTQKQVLEIRTKYISRDPQFGCYAFAKRFGVHKDTISSIIRRVIWKYI